MKKEKFIFLEFVITAANQVKEAEIEMPVGYDHIESISFVCPALYPLSAKINRLEIDNQSNIVDSGLFVGFFQESYFADNDNKIKNIDCKELGKIKMSIQDAGAYVANGSVSYTLQVVCKVSKK